MCNANNHYDGCTCGFGGEGHLGGGGIGRGAVLYRYDSSMRDLAIELGYPLIFPTICRYCGEEIWLFAHPNGGFAIFDKKGVPWPKHECWGIHSDSTRYAVMEPSFEREHRFPIPRGTQTGVLQAQTTLTGTIVALEGTASSVVTLYDGRRIYRVSLTNPLPIGSTVTGMVDTAAGTPRLRDLHLWEIPKLRVQDAADVRGQPTELKGLKTVDIWQFQADAAGLRAAHPDTSQNFSIALDALLNGFTLVGVAVLVGILRTVSDHVPAALKARYVSAVFQALAELRLEPVGIAVWNALSRGVRESAEGDGRRIQAVLRTGELRRKMEDPSRVGGYFATRLRKESRYLAGLKARYPVVGQMVDWLGKCAGA